MVTTKGIVIKEKSIGDNDKYLEILTADLGVIEVKAKSSKKLTSKSFSACNIYNYSDFCLREYKGKYYIDSTSPIVTFFGLSESIEKLALLVYFGDIIKVAVTDAEEGKNILDILIKAIYFLEKDTVPTQQIKAVFELLVMSELGFMPSIDDCHGCGSENNEYFSIENACFYCKNCKTDSNTIKVTPAVVTALRYILTSNYKKAFLFKLNQKESLDKLCLLAQKYVFYHLDMPFVSLDYYHKVKLKG